MSGHSKWSTIKRKKGAADAKRGKIFSKLAKALMVAARGGADPQFNIRLRAAVDAARSVSMPNDKIDYAIKKGAGQLEGVTLEEVVYEAYGPGGVALYITAITDKKNRTTPEIKKVLSQKGGNLGAPNSVAWQFKRLGVITLPAADASEEKLMEAALEAGAEDLSRQDDVFEIIATPDAFEDVKAAVQAAGFDVATAGIDMVAENPVDVDADVARKNLELIELLDDHDDVQSVSANFNIPREVMAEL